MSRTVPSILAAALVGATLLGSSLAGAADDPTIKPQPCNDVLVTDPAGDQLLFPTVAGGLTATAVKGPDNTDVRRVFFNRRDGVLTANIEITNLGKAYPAESRPNNAVTWAVWFTHGPDALIHYVKAVSNGTAVTYKYGGYTVEDTFVLGEMGDTTGSFFEGPDGVVSIVVPATLVPAGETLTKVSARVSFKKVDNENSYTADRAPDAAADDKSYTQVDCPAPDPTPDPTPEPTATPTATPAGDPGAGAPPAAAPAQTVPLAPAAKKPKAKRSCKAKARTAKSKPKRAKALKRCKRKRAARRRAAAKQRRALASDPPGRT